MPFSSLHSPVTQTELWSAVLLSPKKVEHSKSITGRRGECSCPLMAEVVFRQSINLSQGAGADPGLV